MLHNGYKEFWENYPGLCEPQSYLMMTDSRFTAQEKTFRTKSKSGGAGGAGTVARTDMKMVRANSMKAKTNRLFLDSPEAAGPSKKSTSIKSSLFPSPASRLKEDEAKKIAEEDEGEEIEGDGEKKVAEDKKPKKDAEEQSS